MQRIAFLSFLGVLILLLAFTAHESGSQATTHSCKGNAFTTRTSDPAMLADRR